MAKKSSIRYFTHEQKKRFLRTLRDSKKAWRDYFMFNLMLNTGLRLAETVNLDVKNIFNGYSAKEVLEIQGKGDRIRQIPLNKAIRSHMERYLRQKRVHREDIGLLSSLFLSRNHRRITKRAVQLNFDRWIKASDIEGKYSPHSLRHTVGTELMKKTNNIRKIQEFLGQRR